MSLRIDFRSRDFPASYSFRSGTLSTTWGELLWAALTIGRPSTYHVFRHGPASFHEAIFRLALVRMAVEQDLYGSLRRTEAYATLDPTEKGMVSYFLGMVLCKLFASRLLQTPWLLHLDVFRDQFNVQTLGRSRPDLFGRDISGHWHSFESKGRSSPPSRSDMAKAKAQAQRLVSVGGANCSLHIGSFAFFRGDVLEFYWRDPEADRKDPIKLPKPDHEWRYYFEPSLNLAGDVEVGALADERELIDVEVEIHPIIHKLLLVHDWSGAHHAAREMHEELQNDGYRPDGIKVTAGDSWSRRFDPRERGPPL